MEVETETGAVAVILRIVKQQTPDREPIPLSDPGEMATLSGGIFALICDPEYVPAAGEDETRPFDPFVIVMRGLAGSVEPSEGEAPSFEQVVEEVLAEADLADWPYTETVKVFPYGDQWLLECHLYADANPETEATDDGDELSYEELTEVFRDAEVLVEVADSDQPGNEHYRVTFLPEGLTVAVDLSGEDPSCGLDVITRRQRAAFRPRVSEFNYVEVALDRAEAYQKARHQA